LEINATSSYWWKAVSPCPQPFRSTPSQITAFNGAKFLGLDNRIGSIATGEQADLIVLEGNPVREIADIVKVTLVFKDGIGFDSAKLIQSVHGHVGLH
jgi:adenine deaminase